MIVVSIILPSGKLHELPDMNTYIIVIFNLDSVIMLKYSTFIGYCVKILSSLLKISVCYINQTLNQSEPTELGSGVVLTNQT